MGDATATAFSSSSPGPSLKSPSPPTPRLERQSTLTRSGSSRHILLLPPNIPRSPSSRHLLRANDAADSAIGGGAPNSPTTAAQRRKQRLLETRNRRSFNGGHRPNEPDFRFDVFFHIPGHAELQRLRVHRSLTLIGLQALIQREFAIPFEDQRVYCHGDLLEGDDDLATYDIHDQSVLNVRVRKRYRPIGDVFTKIKTVRFLSRTGTGATTAVTPTATTTAEDFEVVEVTAPLPPTTILFRRLIFVVTYLQRLDGLQFARTQRRVWKTHVRFWEDTKAPPTPGGRVHRTGSTLMLTGGVVAPALATDDESAGFVLANSGPERVSYVLSLAQTHAIAQRLQLPLEARTTADIRHIKKWLAGITYFANANIPDPAFVEIARASGYARVRAGDFIFRQGDLGDNFYILVSGCVCLAAYGNGHFATLTPGRCFGEISLFEGQGLRTASANVSFATPFAELLVLPGDIYRRVINPYKQAVLLDTEKAIYSFPQLRGLPDNIVTHIAYASKTLTARPGKRLIRCGEDVHVLVLLVKGEVKVSTPRSSTTSMGGRPMPVTASVVGHLRNQHHQDHPHSCPVVSVVRSPAIFGQEGCLSITPTPAPWDIEALGTCTLVCLRADTISIFLAPRQELIRSINHEHTQRIQDFRQRFLRIAAELERSARRASAARRSLSQKRASYVRLMASSRHVDSTTDSDTDGGSCEGLLSNERRRARGAARIPFPKILLRVEDEDTASVLSSRSERRRSIETVTDEGGSEVAYTPHEPPTHSAKADSDRPAAKSFAEAQDAFLSCILPFGNILSLREQIRYASFAQQKRRHDLRMHRAKENAFDRQDVRGKNNALIRGLRQLDAEEVELAPDEEIELDSDYRTQYHFVARAPRSPAAGTGRQREHQLLRRGLMTR